MHRHSDTRHAARSGLGLGNHFLFWLVALDTGRPGARMTVEAEENGFPSLGREDTGAEAEGALSKV